MAPTTVRTKTEILQIFLATAIKNGSKNGESLDEIEQTCRFVAAAFSYRDLPTLEDIIARQNDRDITEAVYDAMRRAGVRGAE